MIYVGRIVKLISHNNNYINIKIKIYNYDTVVQVAGVYLNDLSNIDLDSRPFFYFLNNNKSLYIDINSFTFIPSHYDFFVNNDIYFVDSYCNISVGSIVFCNNLYKSLKRRSKSNNFSINESDLLYNISKCFNNSSNISSSINNSNISNNTFCYALAPL